MPTIEAMLRRAIEASGPDLILTLDPVFQGLPDTAHGGSVLAVFDALSGESGAREVSGVYRRRGAPRTPLAIGPAPRDPGETFAPPPRPGVLVDGPLPPAPSPPLWPTL